MQHAIIVLNGANGAAVEVEPLTRALAPYGTTYTPNLMGHGGRPVPARHSLPAMADDLIEFLDREGIARAIFVGFSLGGLISLYLARHYPQRITGVCGVATKFIIDEATVTRWEYLGDPARLGRPGNPRAQELAAMHLPQDWRTVNLVNNQWYRDLGAKPPVSDADLQAITVPVTLFSGRTDPVVGVEEQKQLADLLRCRLRLYPGPMHPLTEAPATLAADIGAWIETLPADHTPRPS